MTTAIRPTTAKNWAEILDSLGAKDDSTDIQFFNDILYNFAMFGRFGVANLPHEYDADTSWDLDDTDCRHCNATEPHDEVEWTLDEKTIIATFRTWRDDSPWFNRMSPFAEGEEANKHWENVGRIIGVMVAIARTKPTVGHFVGGGKERNDLEAEEYING